MVVHSEVKKAVPLSQLQPAEVAASSVAVLCVGLAADLESMAS